MNDIDLALANTRRHYQQLVSARDALRTEAPDVPALTRKASQDGLPVTDIRSSLRAAARRYEMTEEALTEAINSMDMALRHMVTAVDRVTDAENARKLLR